MVLSSYLLHYPYTIVWRIVKALRKHQQMAIYCADILDYVVLEPVLRYLPSTKLRIVAKNYKVKRELRALGITSRRWPVFPDVVIMARHALHKFPARQIKKIGFRHGAYHFKDFIKPEKYNAFDLYFFTSRHELQQASAIGIRKGYAIGFPKIDAAFDGSISPEQLSILARRLRLDTGKKTIIFSATWDGSGMSAIEQWVSNLDAFSDTYNILVTVHPFMSKKYLRILKHNPRIRFIRDRKIMPYLMLADILVSDTSSIIAEFCVLDKPIITFKVSPSRRLSAEIERLLDQISIRIASWDELSSAVEKALQDPCAQSHIRREYSKRIFDSPDGKAGARAAQIIRAFVRNSDNCNTCARHGLQLHHPDHRFSANEISQMLPEATIPGPRRSSEALLPNQPSYLPEPSRK